MSIYANQAQNRDILSIIPNHIVLFLGKDFNSYATLKSHKSFW